MALLIRHQSVTGLERPRNAKAMRRALRAKIAAGSCVGDVYAGAGKALEGAAQ